MLLNVALVIGTFLFMEGVAWFTHKYIMHGWLWSWHEDHHNHHKGFFEWNDLFAIVFSAVAITLIVVGLEVPSLNYLTWLGAGVTLYGAFYFIFHDVIVHQRVKFKHKFQSRYMKRIIRAHYIHHKVHTKEGAQAFGFLYAPKRYDVPVKTAKAGQPLS
nr:sterol desaturase family protein [uncultured Arsenicibacter sp.]